ncbi:hypothetical protein [Helicobacter sp. 13S00477-4]|uniref:hypothetical protein n=1 Tax=Helicobacter sp. 13S00477-4 TaxID=1905759 RepID=UPI000BA5DBF9|nr:hypothetical protein [Helicobacter sp. 13S00477-4]PAF51302.1 hypothetical protein BKH44_06245 [Helicobacter sp. 13S00477-4]
MDFILNVLNLSSSILIVIYVIFSHISYVRLEKRIERLELHMDAQWLKTMQFFIMKIMKDYNKGVSNGN